MTKYQVYAKDHDDPNRIARGIIAAMRPYECDICPYNQEQKEGSSRIAGPCGQQNCWIEIMEDNND